MRKGPGVLMNVSLWELRTLKSQIFFNFASLLF